MPGSQYMWLMADLLLQPPEQLTFVHLSIVYRLFDYSSRAGEADSIDDGVSDQTASFSKASSFLEWKVHMCM